MYRISRARGPREKLLGRCGDSPWSSSKLCMLRDHTLAVSYSHSLVLSRPFCVMEIGGWVGCKTDSHRQTLVICSVEKDPDLGTGRSYCDSMLALFPSYAKNMML